MQPIRFLYQWLEENAVGEHYLFSSRDLRQLFPHLSDSAFKTMLSRAARNGHLARICRGLYAYQKSIPLNGYFLFHVATYLRANEFNYISHETVLSDLGIISQVPINLITIMSSGRSNIISCGKFGRIEFIHTNKKPTDIMEHLVYDPLCKLWRADAVLALRDMKAAQRNCDLIDWEVAHEFV